MFCCLDSDAADKVVQGTGKFEELVVASHDIAASTAQLVAASRVKARPKSEKLKSLKASSRNGIKTEILFDLNFCGRSSILMTVVRLMANNAQGYSDFCVY